ncbi:hypothetical protein M0812_11554 [Anaeramoeba flamelloides]|uniref:Uncharacterized protein n=1 Tax=Anaeramoeba flamelloides TaxID=1746091 RepID=A0AAV7ZYV4_9EUKA|nr:hypothetical protein M0812_11554 [Anaeramoeba flamelloides]
MNKRQSHTIDKNCLEFFSRKYNLGSLSDLKKRSKRKPILTRKTKQIICKYNHLPKKNTKKKPQNIKLNKITKKKCQQCSTTKRVKRYRIALVMGVLSNGSTIKHTTHQDFSDVYVCGYCLSTIQLGHFKKQIEVNGKTISVQLVTFQGTRSKNWGKMVENYKKSVQRKEQKWQTFVQFEKEKRKRERKFLRKLKKQEEKENLRQKKMEIEEEEEEEEGEEEGGEEEEANIDQKQEKSTILEIEMEDEKENEKNEEQTQIIFLNKKPFLEKKEEQKINNQNKLKISNKNINKDFRKSKQKDPKKKKQKKSHKKHKKVISIPNVQRKTNQKQNYMQKSNAISQTSNLFSKANQINVPKYISKAFTTIQPSPTLKRKHAFSALNSKIRKTNH